MSWVSPLRFGEAGHWRKMTGALMIAKDIMTTQVLTAYPDTTIMEVAKLLVEIEISGLIVLDKESSEVVGVVSEKDIIVAFDFLKKTSAPISDYINREVISVSEVTPIEEISKILVQENVKRVPVLDGKKLLGVVSRRDILRYILKQKT